MSEKILLTINGKSQTVAAGTSVAVAVIQAGITKFRESITGEPRAPFCGMGVCFECRLNINGQHHQRSCQILCTQGMEISTDE